MQHAKTTVTKTCKYINPIEIISLLFLILRFLHDFTLLLYLFTSTNKPYCKLQRLWGKIKHVVALDIEPCKTMYSYYWYILFSLFKQTISLSQYLQVRKKNLYWPCSCCFLFPVVWWMDYHSTSLSLYLFVWSWYWIQFFWCLSWGV